MKQGHHDSISCMHLGRGSNVGGRECGGCHIQESISNMRLGRSGDAKTARKVHLWWMDEWTDGPTDTVTYKVASTRLKIAALIWNLIWTTPLLDLQFLPEEWLLKCHFLLTRPIGYQLARSILTIFQILTSYGHDYFVHLQKNWPFSVTYPYGRSIFEVDFLKILTADSDSSRKSICTNYSPFSKIFMGTSPKM